jgi:hypothetical protein
MSEVNSIRMKMGLGEDDFDFYRCYKCGRLITRFEEMLSFTKKSKNPGAICPCGSPKYSAANPKWYEYFLPRVMYFAWLRIRRIA